MNIITFLLKTMRRPEKVFPQSKICSGTVKPG